MLDPKRFKDLARHRKGILTNVLSERIARLLHYDLVEQIPAQDDTKRFAYHLTSKGDALRPLLDAMRDWGWKWEKGTRTLLGSGPTEISRQCGHPKLS